MWNEIQHIDTREIFSSIFKKNVKPKISSSEEFIKHSLYLEAKTFLHGLLVLEDKLSMAHGLETRVPFLDNDLVDFATKLPVHLKMNIKQHEFLVDENEADGKREVGFKEGKKILRKTFSRYIPEKVINRKKQGFSAPDASWFKGESIEYVKNIFFAKNSYVNEVLDLNEVKKIFNEHILEKCNFRLAIWSFLYIFVTRDTYFSNE